MDQGKGCWYTARIALGGLKRPEEGAIGGSAGGAELVRLKVWRTHSPPPVEMVVATAKPAPYLRHRLANAAGAAGHGHLFLEVVDSWGSRILEHTRRARPREPSTSSPDS